MSDYSVPKLDSEVQYLIVVKNSSLTKHLIRKLESYNWTLPAIATLDKWMSKHWVTVIIFVLFSYTKCSDRPDKS